VAKASFYRNFATKDDLVVAYLEQRQDQHLLWIDEVQHRLPHSPKEQIYALVDKLIERMESLSTPNAKQRCHDELVHG
jgi:AcrR family transcriptional regulator